MLYELQDATFEKWRPYCHGMCHAPAVSFHQRVTGPTTFSDQPKESVPARPVLRRVVNFNQGTLKCRGKRLTDQRLLFTYTCFGEGRLRSI